MPVDVKQYIEQLSQATGLSEEEKGSLLKLASNEKFSTALGGDLLRQQDYSRSMNDLKKKENDTTAYYSQLVQWKADQDAAYAAALAGTNGNGNGNGGFANGEYISKKDFEEFQKKQAEAAAQREANFITISKKVGRLASRHAAKFGEELDTDALEKVVVEQKVDLDRAYDLMVADRLKQQQETALSERIKREREEAVREFASTRNLPVDSAPRDSSMGRLNFAPDQSMAAEVVPHEGRLTPRGAQQLRQSFIEEWNKAGGTGG